MSSSETAEEATGRLLDRVRHALGLDDDDGAARELVAQTLEVLHQRALDGQLELPQPAPRAQTPLPSKRQAFFYGLADLIDFFPDEDPVLS